MHWADALVKDLTGKQLVSTGISPSGPIHVGNMREILTGDMIFRAAKKAGLDSRFIYLCDDIDPLRKVYPFLPEYYSKYVGQPLSSIPAPDGEGTYSEYFLRPFLETIEKTGIEVEVIRTTNLYKDGVFADAIDVVINSKDKIAKILEELSGRAVGEEWYPYNPKCGKCGKLTTTRVISYKKPMVEYECNCGNHGFSDIRKDDGKMPWRIEWPAKWYTLGVTIEPFGKDHGTPGGSYDTGKRIAEEVFNIPAPIPLIYERILLKGKGAMHSSTGVAIPAEEMLKFAPPHILRFLIARSNPSRHIDFDPTIGLINLIDEYEKYERAYFGQDTVSDEDYRSVVELSAVRPDLKEPDKISFRHLTTLVQIYPGENDLLRALKKAGYERDQITSELREEIKAVKNWLGLYAPESMKFRLLPEFEKTALSDQDKMIASEFLGKIDDVDWEAGKIHQAVYDLIQSLGIKPQEGFSAFYRILIGRDRGPRLGYFLSNLDRDFVKKRIQSSLE